MSDTKPIPAVGQTADTKMEFFLTASHQLKGPVSVIQWCLQSAIEHKEMPPRDLELVSKALMQANAMGQLVTDMLHVFRLEESAAQQTLAPVELHAMLEEIFTQYELIAERRQVHLVRGPMEAAVTVMADASYLKQAIINLVDNGLKYTRPGGAVTVTLSSQGNDALVGVQDQGIGISEADQHHLFTEFFRGAEAQAMTSEGTGLGLVLVKRVVESLGGSVELQSALGKGSLFTLRLPKA